MINEKLVKIQGVDEKDVVLIKSRHELREQIEKDMESLILPQDESKLQELYTEWTTNEFELQKLWKFPQNKNFHRSWYLPHCSCPKIDNEERLGYGMIITSGCPIHNKKEGN